MLANALRRQAALVALRLRCRSAAAAFSSSGSAAGSTSDRIEEAEVVQENGMNWNSQGSDQGQNVGGDSNYDGPDQDDAYCGGQDPNDAYYAGQGSNNGYYNYNNNAAGYNNEAAGYNNNAEPYVPPPPPPPPPPPNFDNKDVPLTIVVMGRSMQMKFQNQKEFDMMLDKTSGFGVMLPDEPGNITRNMCELDPKKVYVLVDSKAVLKMTKKMAREEAEKEGYPPNFMDMMSRNKYGKYVSDDE